MPTLPSPVYSGALHSGNSGNRGNRGAGVSADHGASYSSFSDPTDASEFPAHPGFLRQRLRGKKEVIEDLIAGRVGLLEATARFRELLDTTMCPGSRNLEELCRVVIGWTHLAMQDRPERAESFCGLLERELDAHLVQIGAVRLPGV